MANLEIRPLNAEDYAVAATLEAERLAEDMLSAGVRKGRVAEYLRNPHTTTRILERWSGRDIGSYRRIAYMGSNAVGLYMSDGLGSRLHDNNSCTIFVTRSERRQHIGTKLLELYIDEHTGPTRDTVVSVQKNHEGGQAFLQAHQFSERPCWNSIERIPLNPGEPVVAEVHYFNMAKSGQQGA